MMEQNFDLFPATVVIFPVWSRVWPGYWQDLDFRRLPIPWGLIFQRSGLQSTQDLGAGKNLPSRCPCLGQIVILVLACAHTAPHPFGEGAPSPIFPKGRGVSTISGPNTYQTSTLAKMNSFSLWLCYT